MFRVMLPTSFHPPSPVNSHPEAAGGLIETLGSPATERQPAAPPISASDLALWQAVREELRTRVSAVAWQTWLQHVRPLSSNGGLWQLRHLSTSVATPYEQHYSGEIAAALGEVLGRLAQVEFISERPCATDRAPTALHP